MNTRSLKDEPTLVAFFNAAAKYAGVTLSADYADNKNYAERKLSLNVHGSDQAVERFIEVIAPAFVSTPLEASDISRQFESAVITKKGYTPLYAVTPLTTILHEQRQPGELYPHSSDKRRVSVERLTERHFASLDAARKPEEAPELVPAVA